MQYVPVSSSKNMKKADAEEDAKQNNHTNQEGPQAIGKGKQ